MAARRASRTARSAARSRPPSFALRVVHAFGVRDRERGQGYFDAGRVQLGPVDENGAGAEVQGSMPDPYTVLVDWGNQDLEGALGVFCDCPRFFDGYLCKHLWATFLALDAAGESARVPGAGRLEIVEDEELGAGFGWDDPWTDPDEDWDDEDEAAFWRDAPWVPGEITDLRSEPGASWRQRLEAIRELTRHEGERASDPAASSKPEHLRRTELWYALNLFATRSRGHLVIDLYQRRERKDGRMGAIKPCLLDGEKLAELTDPVERELADLVLALPPEGSPWDHRHELVWSAFRGHQPPVRSIRVPDALDEIVVPRLAATGRLTWWEGVSDKPDTERRLAWDEGPPWRFSLRLSRADREGGPDEALVLSPELTRGDQVEPLHAPLVLLRSGLVLFEDRVARLDAGEVFPWIARMRLTGGLEIPEEDLAGALESLAGMPTLPTLEVADDLPVDRESPAARPHLRLEPAADPPGSGGGLPAELSFGYGSLRVKADDPRSVLIEPGEASKGRILVRDREGEAAARRLLAELSEAGESSRGAVFVPEERFAPLVERLLEEGWGVEARGGPVRRAGRFHLSVTTGIDWFDLAGGIEFDGRSVPLPRLLEAARRGEGFVELGDGSRGLLPRGWMERYGRLADFAGEASEDGVRVLPSQALLLDLLLASAPDAEIEIDRGFSRLLRRLEEGARPEPVEAPAGFEGELRRYQKEGVGWLSFLAELGLGGCLADDMGLGKTVQVLAHLQARKVSREERASAESGTGAPADRPLPSLVVAPRSLVYNWLDEAARFTPGLATLDYTGSRRKALRERFGEHDLVVTTYGTLRRDAAALREIRFDHAVLDEAQAIKNPDSQTAKAARLLQADHRLILTGTPVENHLGELGSLFEYLNPGMLGRSSKVQELVSSPRLQRPDETPLLAELARGLAPFILRRTKAEVLPELPPKTEQTLLVTLSRSQRSLYDEIRDHYRTHLTERIEELGLARSKMHVLEALLRLRQAACHPGLIDRECADERSAKLESFSEQLTEVLAEGHKALVFSQFTSFLGLVRRDLDREGVPYEYLDGKTRNRASRVERFQTDPSCRLFLISLKAGGTGLNLTAADYVFLLDPWWNPAVETQAVDRAHRIGQDRPVIAYRLIARDTVEERILELQSTKRDLADAVLAASGVALRKLSVEDLELLLS